MIRLDDSLLIANYKKQRIFIMFNENPWKNKGANYNQIHVVYF